MLFYVVGNIGFWEFIHRQAEVSARTKEYIALRLAKKLIAFAINLNLFKFRCLIYVVGNIGFWEFIHRQAEFSARTEEYIVLCLAKSELL